MSAVSSSPDEPQRLPAEETRRRGLAQAQAIMREVNEQIHQLEDRFGELDLRSIVCECSHVECMEPIRIGPDRYEEVRRFSTRFILVPGHEIAEVERVVESHNGYVVVENVGIGAEVAIRLDPRRRREAAMTESSDGAP